MRASNKRAVLKPHRDLRPLPSVNRTLVEKKYSRIWP